MSKKFRTIAYNHIQGNAMIYFFVCMFFIIGISAGAFTVKTLADYQKQELISYMKSFFQILSNKPIDGLSVLKQSLINNLQTATFIWILGITVVGVPLILLLIAIRGLIIGFTVGFLVEQLGVKGILFSFISVFPQNLVIIPSIIVIAVMGIGFSKMIIRNKFNKSYNTSNNTFKQFILYSTINAFIFTFIIAGCIIEAYVTPVFMKILSSYM
ncbi:stage II sporulation protein M [Marinisporobacter balticus]|uniref:Stage II sporulation protein M n=1 Tax=Marinisporobacter balticus TaxID=2018667 RepID=A0A4R2KYT3_9FIRM|nr:stage II sporulation protein M [Marinisporobacter balticus]TCO79831.1 stage II sporulation protein M [Marinisporobacter balticus]